MDINNEELEKDLTEQYAILVEEEQEEKKKRRYLILFIVFLFLFLMMFGTTFSYLKIYGNKEQQKEEVLLKDLYVEGYEDSFKFDSNIYKYALSVPNGTRILNIKYTLGCQKCSVDIKGNDDLSPGSNEIEVIVKDQDGNETKYIIYVVVEEPVDEEDNKPNGDNSSNNGGGNTNPTDNGNNSQNNNPQNSKNLDLKSLDVTNHELNEKFDSKKTSYIVDGIKDNEQSIEISYEIEDPTNTVIIKLNDEVITRVPKKEGNEYKLPLDVQTELTLGANKVEIIIKDEDGNEKTYYIYLVVEKFTENDQVVKEITVEYGNNDGKYNIGNIAPGWQSSERQYIKISNKSNYDVNVDIDWTQVTNTFVNKDDVQYTFYVENNEIHTKRLPSDNENIVTSLEIPANSTIYCYIGYKYIYRNVDQNIDQGKTFNGVLKVSLTQQ